MGQKATYCTTKIKESSTGLTTKKYIVITLLFMMALRHWTTLCWFLLSIFSCLWTQETNEAQSTTNCTFSYTYKGH